MKTKTIDLFFIAISVMLLLFPITIILCNSLITTIVLLVLSVGLFYFKPIKLKIFDSKYLPFLIFGLTFISRLICVLLLNDNMIQISDFGTALSNANTLNFVGRYFQVFTHWILYPTFIHYIFQLFGSSQLVALIFNCFCISFISVFIYLIGKKIFGDNRPGLIGSMIYLLWPSNILYVAIFTPDHVVALLLLIAVFLFIHFNQTWEKVQLLKNISVVVLIGVVLALSVFFKNFAPVLLISIGITIILEFFKRKDLMSFFKKIIFVLILLISYIGAKQVIFSYVETLVGDKVGRNIAPCYINVGLNSISKGNYNDQVYQMYFDVLEQNNLDFDKTNTIIMKSLYEDIKKNYQLLPKLFYHKTVTSFETDGSKLNWVVESIQAKKTNKISGFISQVIIPISHIYYIFVIIFMTVYLFVNNRLKNTDSQMLFIFIFGIALMFILTEAQGRYKYAIEPIMCLLAGAGIYNYKNIFRSEKNEKLYKINET